jgi:hypothetical protein
MSFMLQKDIYIYMYSLIWLLLNSLSHAYHMQLIVQQTPILLELRHVKWPYLG